MYKGMTCFIKLLLGTVGCAEGVVEGYIDEGDVEGIEAVGDAVGEKH